MQPKSLPGAALFFLLLANALGCSAPPGAVAPPEPITLRVSCPAGPAADVVRRHSRAWQARANAVVEVKEYGADGPDGAADVWVIAPAELGRRAVAGELRPVPADLQAEEAPFGWKGLLPMYREHLLLWDRTAYALPLLGAAPLLCYRSDLFKDAGLRPPATWKDVEDAAALFKMKGRTPSLPPLPADDDGLEREFYSVAAGYVHRVVSGGDNIPQEAFSFHYDLKTGKPRIDSPGFVYALALLQRLQAYRGKPGLSPIESFRTGACVCCLTDAAQIFRLQDEKSGVRDKFAVTRVPGAEASFGPAARKGDRPADGFNWMPYLGADGWLGVVPTTAVHSEEAFGLLAELGGRDVSRQVVLGPRAEPPSGGGAFRSDHFDRNARWEVFDLKSSQTDAFKEAVQQTLEHRNVANPVYRLRTPDEGRRRALLAEALRAALAKPDADPAEALATVARSWEALDSANAKYWEEYRLAIGLPAR